MLCARTNFDSLMALSGTWENQVPGLDAWRGQAPGFHKYIGELGTCVSLHGPQGCGEVVGDVLILQHLLQTFLPPTTLACLPAAPGSH